MHTPRFVKTLLFLLAAILIGGQAPAQAPQRMTSGEIYNAIEKLGVLGTALYVAAHPDDENTRLISYLSNERKVHTTYLSLTRGDGGQNLVGPEIRELLGLIRTQELLMARQLDGGHQR
ncbi:MAG: LmbE family protein, partial [Saprospiraceae bacterium]|nr:LmbE family protein [Saprospiraceae bacterium]